MNKALIALVALNDADNGDNKVDDDVDDDVDDNSGAIVGHILVSPIQLDNHPELSCAGIAPLSVLPRAQNCGIGTAVMTAAIVRAKAMDIDALFLLGDPAYYHRFGFHRSHIGNDYGATDAFKHLELSEGWLDKLTDHAHYDSAFAEADQ